MADVENRRNIGKKVVGKGAANIILQRKGMNTFLPEKVKLAFMWGLVIGIIIGAVVL